MSRLVPKLRFEEFSGEWEEKELIEICEKISQGGTPSTSKQEYWNGNIEWLTPAEMGGLNTRYIKSTNRKITKEGLQKCSSDLLPINSVILSTRAPIGHILINKKEMAINQGCKALIPKINISYNYLYYSLLRNKRNLNDLGAGNTFKELSAQALKSFQITMPQTKEEQQKIANTLSSLDSLIEALNKKVEALKKHKKGLMQQLFPSEGETVPKLRFEGFGGEWEKKQINEILTIGSGRDYKHLSNGNIPVYGTGGYMLSVNDYLYDGESVCIGRKGTIDKPVFLTGKFWTVDTLFYTHSFKNNIPRFIYMLFQKINWYKYNEASGVPSLSKVTIGKINIFIPKPKEQQKIANTLSSLDSFIEAQNKKIETLKKHKKGLMQQMFVSAEVGV